MTKQDFVAALQALIHQQYPYGSYSHDNHCAMLAVGDTQGAAGCLSRLFFEGPMWVEVDDPRSRGLVLLYAYGLAGNKGGWAYLADSGVDLALKLGFGSEKAPQSAGDAQ